MPVHTSSPPGAKNVNELLVRHLSWCKVEFRMEPKIFKTMKDILRRKNLLRDTEGTIAVFLREITCSTTHY
jgi:hypothetical protein